MRVAYTEGTAQAVVLRTAYGLRAATTKGHRDAVVAVRASRPLGDHAAGAETARDVRMGKRRGVDREVQTGDEEFDAAVYVDTTATDAAVLFVLSPPEVRASLRALLVDGGFASVCSSDDERGRRGRDLHRRFPEARAGRLRGQRPRSGVPRAGLAPADGPGARWVKPWDRGRRILLALVLAALAGLVLEVVLMFAMAPPGCGHREGAGLVFDCGDSGGRSCCAPLGVGALVGAPAGVVVGLLAATAFRGRSDSSRRRVVAFFFVAAIVFELALMVAQAVMW